MALKLDNSIPKDPYTKQLWTGDEVSFVFVVVAIVARILVVCGVYVVNVVVVIIEVKS